MLPFAIHYYRVQQFQVRKVFPIVAVKQDPDIVCNWRIFESLAILLSVPCYIWMFPSTIIIFLNIIKHNWKKHQHKYVKRDLPIVLHCNW